MTTTQLDELISNHRELMYQAQINKQPLMQEMYRVTIQELEKWQKIKPLIKDGILGVGSH